MSTYKDIRTKFEVALNENIKYPSKWMKDMHIAYNTFNPNGRWIAPKSKTGVQELLRAELDNSAPEDDIVRFLAICGIAQDDYSIESGDISGKFDSWLITMNVDYDYFGKKLSAGTTYGIVNAIDFSGGVKQVIGDKDLTPDRLQVTQNIVGIITSPEKLLEILSKPGGRLESVINDKNYLDFCKELLIAVYGYTPSKRYTDINDLGTDEKVFDIVHDFSKYVDLIDAKSIRAIEKDFGEILGGLLMFNLVKKIGPGNGLSFPTESNAPLTDFTFDGLNVSSKAGKGAKPSSSGFIKQINAHVAETGYTLTPEEQEVMDKVLNPLVSTDKERKNVKFLKKSSYSTTFTNSVKLFEIHLGGGTAWDYWKGQTGLSGEINRDDFVESFITLKENGNLNSTLSQFVNMTKIKSSKADVKKLLTARNEQESIDALDLIMAKGKFDILIGIILYGCSKELQKHINANYSETLSGLINKATQVKQLYMKTKIKKGLIGFKLKSMDVSKFILGTLNGIESWKLKAITISML